MKVLFVCLGNICRSPMAEAIFKKKVVDAGLGEEVKVDSCGTANYHIGEYPDHRTIKVVEQNNIPIDHQVRQLNSRDFFECDFIIAMDNSNMEEILSLNPSGAKAHVHLMRDFDPKPDHSEVPDPYYGGEKGFQEVFEMLDRSTAHLLDKISGNL